MPKKINGLVQHITVEEFTNINGLIKTRIVVSLDGGPFIKNIILGCCQIIFKILSMFQLLEEKVNIAKTFFYFSHPRKLMCVFHTCMNTIRTLDGMSVEKLIV